MLVRSPAPPSASVEVSTHKTTLMLNTPTVRFYARQKSGCQRTEGDAIKWRGSVIFMNMADTLETGLYNTGDTLSVYFCIKIAGVQTVCCLSDSAFTDVFPDLPHSYQKSTYIYIYIECIKQYCKAI